MHQLLFHILQLKILCKNHEQADASLVMKW